MEERESIGKKQNTNVEKKFAGTGKRSPLQDLNGLQIQNTSWKKSSSSNPNFSSSSSKCCLSFLISSSAAAASSSRTLTEKTPKSVTKLATNSPKKSKSKVLFRSKEKGFPQNKHFSQKSKFQTPCINPYSNNAKPGSKIGQRSKISSGPGNHTSHLKKGSREFGGKTRISGENDSGKPSTDLFGLSDENKLNFVEIITPSVKVVNFVGHRNMNTSKSNDSCATAVKTPPVEASVSPEIENGSKMVVVVSKSRATPVCYGAGHLLSGVADKRKCRRRGSLKGGLERAKLSYNDENSWNANIVGSVDSSIPLLAEASVRWHLSPCDEGSEAQGSHSGNRLDRYKGVRPDDASVALDLLLSSPPSLNRNISACSYSGNGSSIGPAVRDEKARVVIISPRKDLEIQGLLGTPSKKIEEHLVSTTPPPSIYQCEGVTSKLRERLSHLMIRDHSDISVGSLSSGNVIQTPNLYSSSDRFSGGSNVGIRERSFVQSEPDLIATTLDTVSLSPGREMPLWDKRPLSADMKPSSLNSVNTYGVQMNMASFSSWVSDYRFERLSLSGMRVSWRDGSEIRIIEDDEFDCCRCFSDEEVHADGYSDSQSRGGVSDISPELLESKAFMSSKKKDKLFPKIANECAESICTNEAGLIASRDSDWSKCFENDLFKV